MPGGFDSCIRITKQIVGSSNANNNYCGDEKLLNQLRGVYLSLDNTKKSVFVTYVKWSMVGKLNFEPVGIGLAVGYAAAELLPEAFGATLPAGIIGKAAVGLSAGFFATKASSKILFDKGTSRREAQKVMPYLHILTHIPIQLINEGDKKSIEGLHHRMLEIIAQKAEQKPIEGHKAQTEIDHHQAPYTLRKRR